MGSSSDEDSSNDEDEHDGSGGGEDGEPTNFSGTYEQQVQQALRYFGEQYHKRQHEAPMHTYIYLVLCLCVYVYIYMYE